MKRRKKEDYLREEKRQSLLENPNVEAAREYYSLIGRHDILKHSDTVILASVHKARVEVGLGVAESLMWLESHGMSSKIDRTQRRPG